MKTIYLRSFVLKLMVLVVVILAFVNTIKKQGLVDQKAENTINKTMPLATEHNLGK